MYDDFLGLVAELEWPVNSDMSGFTVSIRGFDATEPFKFTLPPGEHATIRVNICPPADAFTPGIGLFARRDSEQFAEGNRCLQITAKRFRKCHFVLALSCSTHAQQSSSP